MTEASSVEQTGTEEPAPRATRGLDREDAVLVLEDGYALRGRAYGLLGRTVGEVVFTTAMTGYQETLTDPSYHRQIVVQTAPHIGNTGVNEEDPESSRVWVAGYVVRDAARVSSNWRSTADLEDWLVEQGVVGLTEVDTRALTRHLRERGAMRAGIFSGAALPSGAEHLSEQALQVLVDIVQGAPAMSGADLAREVSTGERYVLEPSGAFEGRDPVAHVVAVDLGIKSRSPYHLAERGARVTVVPQSITLSELLALQPDGVFFSNGPGDPAAATHEVELLRGVLDAKVPYFGICFGNQLLGRALGFGTYKLRYGHRGTNIPVLDRSTDRVEITSQNHGFAVDAPVDEPSVAPFEDGRYGRVEVSHVCLNDGVVEGLRALDLPAFSVQYHPEAAAGPHDGEHLFNRFLAAATAHRGEGTSADESTDATAPAAPSALPEETR